MLEFDPAKESENIRKHGVSLSRFADMDESTWYVIRDDRHYNEERWIFFGLINGVLYCAVVTYRGERMRIISLRRASRRERKMYDEAKAGR